jgi:hypothetical protein
MTLLPLISEASGGASRANHVWTPRFLRGALKGGRELVGRGHALPYMRREHYQSLSDCIGFAMLLGASKSSKSYAPKRRFVEALQFDLGCPVRIGKIFRLTRRANQF